MIQARPKSAEIVTVSALLSAVGQTFEHCIGDTASTVSEVYWLKYCSEHKKVKLAPTLVNTLLKNKYAIKYSTSLNCYILYEYTCSINSSTPQKQKEQLDNHTRVYKSFLKISP